MQSLFKSIEQFVVLSDDAREAIEQLAEKSVYAKNQYILEPGLRCNRIWFIVKGMVRKFHLADGKEITTWIHTENETFTSLQSYAQDTPTEEFLQACEPTEVISITKSNSSQLARFPEMMAYTSAMMEREFVHMDVHTKAMNRLDARGRYKYLQQIAPAMVRRARLGDIASIIGVTQETLSRIRKV